jgi:hypothetical protein
MDQKTKEMILRYIEDCIAGRIQSANTPFVLCIDELLSHGRDEPDMAIWESDRKVPGLDKPLYIRIEVQRGQIVISESSIVQKLSGMISKPGYKRLASDVPRVLKERNFDIDVQVEPERYIAILKVPKKKT